MHGETLDPWRHEHDFLTEAHVQGEQRTRRVIVLTATMMVAEILAGTIFGSMALLADGWHMASHASALGITAFAYAYARRHQRDERYSFGTWKVGVLGGFTSAVVLGVIAVFIAWESVGRVLHPVEIRFDEAIIVAFLGLAVNLVSAWMLHSPGSSKGHLEHGHHHDHNLRSAYLHVLADALTSVLAIVALGSGRYLGWAWMDPLMGIVGSAVIASWSYGLLRETSRILLDGSVDPATLARAREAVERDADNAVADMHLWRVGPADFAAIVSVVTHHPRPPAHYERLIAEVVPVSHVTIQVNRCRESVSSTQGAA